MSLSADLFKSKEPPKCAFSPCMRYRYTLWRRWGQGALYQRRSDQYIMVVGLNPSTADDKKDDPTIKRCIRFAKDWGFGGLCMTNIFAWRDTLPKNMKKAPWPIQPPESTRDAQQNDMWLQRCADDAGMILGAWGIHGTYLERSKRVIDMLPPMECLGVTKNQQPKHPLYIAANTLPIDYLP